MKATKKYFLVLLFVCNQFSEAQFLENSKICSLKAKGWNKKAQETITTAFVFLSRRHMYNDSVTCVLRTTRWSDHKHGRWRIYLRENATMIDYFRKKENPHLSREIIKNIFSKLIIPFAMSYDLDAKRLTEGERREARMCPLTARIPCKWDNYVRERMTLWKQHLHAPTICHNFGKKIRKFSPSKVTFDRFFNAFLFLIFPEIVLSWHGNLIVFFCVFLLADAVLVCSICWSPGKSTCDFILQGKDGNVCPFLCDNQV